MSFQQVVADVDAGAAAESQYTEFKGQGYGRSDGERRKAAIDMASLAVHGGSLVLGVRENKDTGLAERVCPIPLAGTPEWLAQVAAMKIDPPLPIACTVLNDPADASCGVIIVDIPASPLMVHQVDGIYRSRADRINIRLADPEVERLLRLRECSTDRIHGVLASAVTEARPQMQPVNTPQVGWMTIAVEPAPIRDTFLLRRALADNAYPAWLRHHTHATAVTALLEQLQTNPDWAREIPGNWSPERGQWTYRRTGTGVEAHCTGTAFTSTPLAGILAVDETGAIRLSYNYLVYGPAGAEERDILHWQELIGATLWSLAFTRAITAGAGSVTNLAVGVHVEGIKGMIPGEPNDGVWGQQRRERSHARDPIPIDIYDAATLIPAAELGNDWRHAVDRLFGRLVRTMGMGDLLAPLPDLAGGIAG